MSACVGITRNTRYPARLEQRDVEGLAERMPPRKAVEHEDEPNDDPDPDAVTLVHCPPKVRPVSSGT